MGKRQLTKPNRRARSDDEYAVVSLGLSWGLLSLALFFFNLPVRGWTRLLPWHPGHYYSQPGKLALYTLLVAVVGMIFGWFGRRSERHAAAARWGLILNALIAGTLVIAIIGLIMWWRLH